MSRYRTIGIWGGGIGAAAIIALTLNPIQHLATTQSGLETAASTSGITETTPPSPVIQSPVYSSSTPTSAVSYDAAGNVYPVASCTAIGGNTIEDLNGNPACAQIAYIGSDGQTYYTSVPIADDGTLTGPADTAGTGATQDECDSGNYPDGAAGPTSGPDGQWDSQLQLCLTGGGQP